jgi:hypothetical protein
MRSAGGTLEGCVAQLGVVAVAVGVDSRRGHRLAALIALVKHLAVRGCRAEALHPVDVAPDREVGPARRTAVGAPAIRRRLRAARLIALHRRRQAHAVAAAAHLARGDVARRRARQVAAARAGADAGREHRQDVHRAQSVAAVRRAHSEGGDVGVGVVVAVVSRRRRIELRQARADGIGVDLRSRSRRRRRRREVRLVRIFPIAEAGSPQAAMNNPSRLSDGSV